MKFIMVTMMIMTHKIMIIMTLIRRFQRSQPLNHDDHRDNDYDDHDDHDDDICVHRDDNGDEMLGFQYWGHRGWILIQSLHHQTRF